VDKNYAKCNRYHQVLLLKVMLCNQGFGITFVINGKLTDYIVIKLF